MYQELDQLEQINQKLIESKKSGGSSSDKENLNSGQILNKTTATIPEFREEKGYNYKDKSDKDIFSEEDLISVPDGFKKEEEIPQSISSTAAEQYLAALEVEQQEVELP